MPANEIANRLAAAGWVRFEEDPDAAGSYLLGLRSQVSLQNRLIITKVTPGVGEQSFAESPLIIVPLDRELSRRETTVMAHPLMTPSSVNRIDYPWWVDAEYVTGVEAAPDVRVLFEPLHLDWIGDLNAPSWLPFGMGQGGLVAVPDGFDLNIYNAIAFLLSNADDGGQPGNAIGQDFCFQIWQHPPVPEGETAIDDLITIESAG